MARTKITVGPVIGKTTQTDARVLIEVNGDVEVTCNATNTSDNSGVSEKKMFRKNRPSVISLAGLSPGSSYELTFDGVDRSRTGTFKTLPADPQRINIAAVSCNFTSRRGSTDLWADMRDRYLRPGNLDLLFHMGDQIYGDSSFQQAVRVLDGKKRGNGSHERAILELYRGLYRSAWNHPSTRDVLANVSNLMIWDDHEIRDDWGSQEDDSNPDSQSYYIGTLARRVYREYQRQLWEDIDADNDPADGSEHHLHRWGQTGALFVDLRGARSFGREAARPYLGTPQWDEIAASLKPGGAFSNVRALLVVTPVPLVYLHTDLTTLGANTIELANDLKDHWSYEPHRKEQIEFIRALRRWQKEGDATGGAKRKVLVLGGDVHVGGHTDIEHKKKVVFKQLIASPITNRPPKWYEYYGIRALIEAKESLSATYSFEHRDYTNKRNFGIVTVRIPDKPEDSPYLEGSLVKST